jgi:hypothetical protein
MRSSEHRISCLRRDGSIATIKAVAHTQNKFLGASYKYFPVLVTEIEVVRRNIRICCIHIPYFDFEEI